MKSKIIQFIYFTIGALALLTLVLLPGLVTAQDTPPPQLQPQLKTLITPQSTPNWIYFKEGASVNPATIFRDFKTGFQLSAEDTMVLVKKESDNLGFNHFRYQQYFNSRKVVYGEYIVHQQSDGFVKSANGNLIIGLKAGTQAQVAQITEKQALANALQFMNAKRYLWQNSVLESDLKRQEKNENATYFPKGELVYAPTGNSDNLRASAYKLAWHFKIYTDDPNVTAKSVYVDALTGKVIHYKDISMNCSAGTGGTAFNGNVTIHTELISGLYRSHNNCQATDIYVFNCNGGGASNTYYLDADNSWIFGQQSASQAQWGAEMVYSYYNSQHARQSWNGAAGDMIAYNNAFAGSNNACWGCTGNSAIFYAGNTASATDDWNTDDIMGHEFTHGVVQASANLVYQYEPGALNESFADIFGEMVESWAEGFNDYLVGGDRGAIRSFSNPNLYGQPDTYLGTYWYTGTADNGGVHTNSGVQNYWFYLLSEGGSGVNDLGQTYNVTGITRFKARLIAYRALTVYLTSSSRYIDARRASLQAAWDLYGQCSPEIIAVGDAWHAVGVESQSPAYAFNVCGSYPAGGTFIQSISQLTAASSCITTITPSTTTVYFAARDRVILYPGFTAQSGSNFVAYLEPCSSTRWLVPPDYVVMSDAEKGVGVNPKQNNEKIGELATVRPSEITSAESALSNRVVVKPNPFRSTFDVFINSGVTGKAQVIIYNATGAKVNENRSVSVSKGLNKITFDGTKLAQGVYMVETNVSGVKTITKIVKM